MSKLLTSVLDRVSENNNEYRKELQILYKNIEEKTTAIVGDVVTLSNYSLDFSNAITTAKEDLVNPISRILESYIIKDLRSVETVNEQFIDKINDKLDNAEITTNEEKDKFISSLNTLLNEKYLEIVRIKRVDFVAVDGTNAMVEDTVGLYINNIMTKANFDVSRLNDLFSNYKKDIYAMVDVALNKISNLYLNNFVNEIISSLNGIVDITSSDADYNSYQNVVPNIPEINSIPIVEEPEMTVSNEETVVPYVNENAFETPVLDIPVVPAIPEVPEIPQVSDFSKIPVIPEIPEYNSDEFISVNTEEDNNVNSNYEEQVLNEMPEVQSYEPMEQPYVEPIEIEEKPQIKETKKYDVEEILKIAKSPIINIAKEEPKEETFLSIKPIEHVNESKEIELEFDEKEIVEEMIRRLSNRLAMISEKQEEINSKEQKIKEDEEFVNSLIDSSNNKKLELDELERELDAKELELSEKQKELDKKLNDVLPFANAIMKNEEAN